MTWGAPWLARKRKAPQITPAMHLRVTDHIWTISELVEGALNGTVPEMAGRKIGRFSVIDGGRG